MSATRGKSWKPFNQYYKKKNSGLNTHYVIRTIILFIVVVDYGWVLYGTVCRECIKNPFIPVSDRRTFEIFREPGKYSQRWSRTTTICKMVRVSARCTYYNMTGPRDSITVYRRRPLWESTDFYLTSVCLN